MGAASTYNIFEWSVMDIFYKFILHPQVDNIHLFKTINLMLIGLMHDTIRKARFRLNIILMYHCITFPYQKETTLDFFYRLHGKFTMLFN